MATRARSTPRTRIPASNQAPLRFRPVRNDALEKGLTHLPMTPIHPQDRPKSSLFLREKGPGPKSRPLHPTAHSPNDSGAFHHIPPLSHFATIPTPALPRECNCGSGSEMCGCPSGLPHGGTQSRVAWRSSARKHHPNGCPSSNQHGPTPTGTTTASQRHYLTQRAGLKP